jgi:hypothetical protein
MGIGARLVDVLGRVFVVTLGLAVGAVAGSLIGLFTGLIPLSC